MTTRLVAVERPPAVPAPVCRRIGCDAPGTVVTVLCGDRRAWELYHCPDHPDGPQVAHALGFDVVDMPGSATAYSRPELPQAS